MGKTSHVLTVTLRWDRNDVQTVGKLAIIDRVAHLEYDESFLDRAGGLRFNLSPHRYSGGSRRVVRPFDPEVFNGLHGFLHDSLPDGWGRVLTDRRAHELGIYAHELTPVDRLAWVGDRGIGALCYAPDANAWKADGSRIDIDRAAVEMREVMKVHASDVIAELGHIGGSPGGARPKALIAVDSRNGAVWGPTPPEGGTYEQYVVKFRGEQDGADAANVEQAYADMARSAGLRVPETRLFDGPEGGGKYFASRRFDRNGDNRLHAQSASALLYADFKIPVWITPI